MSFILDALRKSEHERQRATVPGLAQVPLAAPSPQLPRWAVVVMGALAVALLGLGGAWWQSTRGGPEVGATSPTVARSVPLPPVPAARPEARAAEAVSPPSGEPLRTLREPLAAARTSGSLAAEASRAVEPSPVEPPPSEREAVNIVELGNRSTDTAVVTTSQLDLPADAPALPSAAALAAEGVSLPPLKLELHAFSAVPRDRFVFINGRKYVEGERLTEGPQLVAIEPAGAVLLQAGRRFLLRQE